jgi:hypothetical protein
MSERLAEIQTKIKIYSTILDENSGMPSLKPSDQVKAGD